jgi:hypothetical protein
VELAMTNTSNPYLLWGDKQRAEFDSLVQLEELIDQLTLKAAANKLPIAVQVCLNAETGLLITVGSEVSHVEFASPSGHPRGVGSRGPWDDDELIEADFMGQISELPRRYWVPIADAREALRRFYLTGARPDNITWG